VISIDRQFKDVVGSSYMGWLVSQTPMRIGNSTIKAHSKLIVQLEGNKLPKIGSRAKIKRKDSFLDIGEVVEVIGTTKKPWIVILFKKENYNVLQEGESIFTEDRRKKEKKQRKKKRGRSSKWRNETRS
jgi:rRNA processing protein Gar1